MRQLKRQLVLGLAFAAFAPNLWAYIDPNAGSVLLQVLLAGAAGLVILRKLLWSRIKKFLGRKEPR